MRFSSTEEYGLRCMLQMAKKGPRGMTTILELSRLEGLTPAYVAKIMSILRKRELVQSLRGQSGGYQLSRPAHDINIHEVLVALGGKFFNQEEVCVTPNKEHLSCIHTMDCAIRSLLMGLDLTLSGYLRKCKLSDLVSSEPDMEKWLQQSSAAKKPHPAAQGSDNPLVSNSSAMKGVGK